MTFKYFERPDLYVGLRDSETACDLCGQSKLCFDAESFFGQEDISSICPECLASGKLYDRDIFTCEGDKEELVCQLKALNPSWTESEVEALATQKTNELEKTTPGLITWQDWRWPCADGDYCRFIGYGSKPLYNRLAKDMNGEAFFKNSFNNQDSDIDDLWSEYLPGQEIRNYEDSNKYGVLFYVFRSLHSDRVITIWDSN